MKRSSASVTLVLAACTALNTRVERRIVLRRAAAAVAFAPAVAHAKLAEFSYNEQRLADESKNPFEFAARRWDYLFRPAPPQSAGLRDRLDMKFAVLLMRTSYAVADEVSASLSPLSHDVQV